MRLLVHNWKGCVLLFYCAIKHLYFFFRFAVNGGKSHWHRPKSNKPAHGCKWTGTVRCLVACVATLFSLFCVSFCLICISFSILLCTRCASRILKPSSTKFEQTKTISDVILLLAVVKLHENETKSITHNAPHEPLSIQFKKKKKKKEQNESPKFRSVGKLSTRF